MNESNILLQRIKTLEAKLKEQESSLREAEEALNIFKHVAKLKRPAIGYKRLGRTGNVEAFSVASDWHLEERVTLGETSGRNEYNLSIFEARSAAFWRKTLWMLELLRSRLYVPKLTVLLLGDFITGHLHEDDDSNYLSPMDATEVLFQNLRMGLRFLLQSRVDLTIVCCSGNHGRTTQRQRHRGRVHYSMENLVYRLLDRERLCTTIIEQGYHTYYTSGNTVLRLHHGDNIRYQGGVGGLFIPGYKAVAQWNRARHADLDVFGHYHSLLDGGNFLCNGSLIGYNAFAVSIKAAYEEPRQLMFGIDAERGRILTAPLLVA